MDAVIILELTISSLMLIVLWHWLFRDAFVDRTRIKLRQLQDDMFREASKTLLQQHDDTLLHQFTNASHLVESLYRSIPTLSVWHLLSVWTAKEMRNHPGGSTTHQVSRFESFEFRAILIVQEHIIRKSLFLTSLAFLLK